MAKESIKLSLDPEVKEQLQKYAEENQTTVSALVTKWFAEEVGLVRVENKYIDLSELEEKMAELNDMVQTLKDSSVRKRRNGFGQYSVVEIKQEVTAQ